MSNDVILKIDNVSLSFGGKKALIDLNVECRRGEIRAVIGPNGAGKTSLINCISGFYRPEKGEIYFEGKAISRLPAHDLPKLGIARTFQNLALYTGMTTLENIIAARHLRYSTNLVTGALFWKWARKEEVEQRAVAEEIIDFLELQSVRKQPVGNLPHGVRKRVELGRALALEPRLLLLDEPMTGMNVEEKEAMARFILDIHEKKGTTIILIEHDMGVVMDLAERIVVLDFGCRIAEGSPIEVQTNPEVMKAYLGTGKT
ncbi:MAG: ABC transporter ATP-binding protein [Chloroflexota bacterium]|nr:MAG: ABC transporter ATP-binding protein [Chloroflexota bacterium]